MSKKLMKRSLALGVLMAFVITGSAMAADTVINPEMPHNYSPNWDVSETINVLGTNGLSSNSTLSRDYYFPADTGKYAEHYAPSTDAPDTYVFNLNDKTLTVPGGIAFCANDVVKITGATSSVLTLNGTLMSKGEVNIGSLIIKNGALRTYGSQQMIVNTGSVYINNKDLVSAYGINLQGEGNQVGGGITMTTDLLSIENCDKYVFRTAYETTLNIDANEISITGETQSKSKATGKSNIILKASSGVIESDFIAGEDGSKGDVNMTLGSGVNWKGSIVTDAGSTSVGSVGLSGTWNLTEASSLTNATFNSGSTLVIDGETFEKSTDKYALNGVGDKASLTVVNGAKIVISGGEVEGVYNVAKDFATNQGANWTLQADNALWYVDWTDLDEDSNTLQGKILTKTADDLVNTGVANNENKDVLLAVAGAATGTNPTADAINELASNSNVSNEDIQKGAAALLQIGEAGGFTGNVVSVSKQVTGAVGARNSFAGPKHGGPRHRGGHGPSVADENNGGAVWAQYVHGKDKVDGIDMGGVENAYESQFNGVVLGMDFKQVGSYASGITFNYGEGDSHSKKNVVQSDSEFDFWGVGYYGAVKKQDTNFIFDIGYSESDSDVEQVVGGNTITANPEASTWTAGVKVEKLIDKGAVQIVPYAGLRYMSIDTDDYKATGSTDAATYYSTERQDIWLLPIGVSMSQENVYDSGWIVTPRADLSYTWAMGDTDSSMTVNMPNVGSDTLGYTVMDDGSFMATVGLDAQKEDWTFGVAYSYQKGDSTRSDRWYVNARYSF